MQVLPFEEFTAEQLLEIAGEIDEAHYKLTTLSFAISAYIRTLPDWP